MDGRAGLALHEVKASPRGTLEKSSVRSSFPPRHSQELNLSEGPGRHHAALPCPLPYAENGNSRIPGRDAAFVHQR